MIVSSYYQIVNFLIAAIIGSALGVVYDFFKVLRLIGINGKIAAFFEDIIFFLICTITIFSYYMQFTQGKFRIYAFIGAVLGFFIYFLTVEKIVFFIVKKIYFFICKVFSFVYNKIVLKTAKFFYNSIKKLVKAPLDKIKRFLRENICIFLKNLLPKKRKMLYNIKRVSKKGKGKVHNGKRKDRQSTKAFFC